MKKPGKKRRKTSMVVFIIEVVVLLVLVGGIFVYAKIMNGLGGIGSATGAADSASMTLSDGTVIPDVADDPNADADAAEENEGISTNESLKGYTNIALVGIDTRDVDQIRYANSDTMIIASINNDTGKIKMVSLYRDTLLNIGTRESSTSQGDEDDEWTVDVEPSGDAGGDEDGIDDTYDNDDDGSDDGDVGQESDSGNSGSSGSGNSGSSGSGSSSSSGSGSSGSSGSGNSGSSGSSSSSSNGSYYDDSDDEVSVDNSSDNYSQSSSYYEDEVSSSETVTYNEETNSEDAESSEYAGNEYYNYSETEETGSSGQLGDTTAAGRYDKANAAYAQGSAKQFLSMLNKNLDLNIHEYVVVDFSAVAILVDDIDGIDVWMTKQEVIHMNNYCVETSRVTGMDYTPITPQEEAQNYHLNGVQAVSYARIRYTVGNDFKRTQRQRVVIENIVKKAKERGLDTVNAMINDVFPLCYTSFSSAEIVSLATQMFNFEIDETSGFPFEHIEKNTVVGSKTLDCVVPVTLADNVSELHEFLFGVKDYVPSATVQEYSNDIKSLTGLTEASEDVAEKNSIIPDNGGEADVVK